MVTKVACHHVVNTFDWVDVARKVGVVAATHSPYKEASCDLLARIIILFGNRGRVNLNGSTLFIGCHLLII